MFDRPNRLRASSLALLISLTGAPRPAPGEDPKAAPSPPADAPKVAPSRSPFHPHSVPMLRQSNRLKASGFGNTAMNDGQIVLALVSAEKLLGRSDQDYQGHRAGAIREIDAAIHQVHSKAGTAGARVAGPVKLAHPGPVPKPAMPRAESDALLREALHTLTSIESHMATGGNVRRLATAHASVKKAIEDLKAALDLR